MQVRKCPQCGKPNQRWMEFCKDCYTSLIDVPITYEEATENDSNRTEEANGTKHTAPDVYTGKFDDTGGTQYNLLMEEVKNQKQLPFMEPGVASILPSICCYCGAPAEEMLDLDARQSQQRYGYKRSAIISYGNRFRVPYCPKHYQLALAIRRKLAGIENVNSNASWIPMLLGIAVGIGGVFRSAITDLKASIPFILLFSLALGGFLGLLLAGALLFLFEPIAAWLTGALVPLFLEPQVRVDLAKHMKAQHEIYPLRILWLIYSLGFSVKYEVSNASYTWKKWNVHVSVCATNAEFASSTEGIQCVRDNKSRR